MDNRMRGSLIYVIITLISGFIFFNLLYLYTNLSDRAIIFSTIALSSMISSVCREVLLKKLNAQKNKGYTLYSVKFKE